MLYVTGDALRVVDEISKVGGEGRVVDEISKVGGDGGRVVNEISEVGGRVENGVMAHHSIL